MSIARVWLSALSAAMVACATAPTVQASGGGVQADIVGPAGSVSFGAAVAVLPNGNIAITDPDGPGSGVGAVYLYTHDGALVNSFTGSTQNDHVGSGGLVVLSNGSFIVLSPHWHNLAVADAGAVTLVDGGMGMGGIVTKQNSLVGGSAMDAVGTPGSVLALNNGNYVVTTPTWTNPDSGAMTPVPKPNAGAATFGNGSGGTIGVVSVGNSLVGTQNNDQVGVGGAVALSVGNYVVLSANWNNAAVGNAGAATWGDGTVGVAGAVSAVNSLVGSTVGDHVGSLGITKLLTGNYLVTSEHWSNGGATEAGAVTPASGVMGRDGPVTSANSLVGAQTGDHVGSAGITVLSNGNYVVASPDCANVSVTKAGAVTWVDPTIGLTGAVDPSNSLVGTQTNDAVGGGTLIGGGPHVAALTNGNYVVISSAWASGTKAAAGAVTWVDGSQAQPGIVSAANSLIGGGANDQVGARGVFALPNGNYVVDSMFWNSAGGANSGAVTLLNGTHRTSATVSTANSLFGTSANDLVGVGGVAVLTNGNFIVGSSAWHNMGVSVGALTWVNGSSGLTGSVTAANSLTGSAANDSVAYAVALTDGNFAAASPFWNGNAGAVTWGNGTVAINGNVAASNSLVGTQANDFVGFRTITPLPGGAYLTDNLAWNNGPLTQAGAITYSRKMGGTAGPIDTSNSVIGLVAGGGSRMVYTYDIPRQTLIVGRPAENLVTLFTTDIIFGSGFQ